jgi:hypothetical protein
MGRPKARGQIMSDNDFDAILEEEGLNKENLIAAIELGRLVGEENGLCCEALGQFVWACYRRLEGDEEWNR